MAAVIGACVLLVAGVICVAGVWAECGGERDWARKLQAQSRQRAARPSPAFTLGPRPIGFSDFIGGA